MPSVDPYPPALVPQLVYQCAALGYSPAYGKAYQLGSHRAATARLALCWLRARATDVVDQLDATAARAACGWLMDQRRHENALTVLTHGRPFVHTILDHTVRYVLSVQRTGKPTEPYDPCQPNCPVSVEG